MTWHVHNVMDMEGWNSMELTDTRWHETERLEHDPNLVPRSSTRILVKSQGPFSQEKMPWAQPAVDEDYQKCKRPVSPETKTKTWRTASDLRPETLDMEPKAPGFRCEAWVLRPFPPNFLRVHGSSGISSKFLRGLWMETWDLKHEKWNLKPQV